MQFPSDRHHRAHNESIYNNSLAELREVQRAIPGDNRYPFIGTFRRHYHNQPFVSTAPLYLRWLVFVLVAGEGRFVAVSGRYLGIAPDVVVVFDERHGDYVSVSRRHAEIIAAYLVSEDIAQVAGGIDVYHL